MTRDHDQRPLSVPGHRLARLARIGGLGAGLAGRVASGGARELAAGRRPDLARLLMTPANAARVAGELARMRGAAMKLGQLISMDAGDMLPPELAAVFDRLRAEAHPMPPAQLKRVLAEGWGPDWLKRFERFEPRPMAAASIGQVHRARTRDGRDLAIKVQYPGVKRSIDSDVANLGAMIRMSGMLPAGSDIAPLLAAARAQLHEEADYAREAVQLSRFGDLLAGDARFRVPRLAADLSTPSILAMSFEPGRPIESLAQAPRDTRDAAMAALLELGLRELFDWRLMQTDPNFANYRVADDGAIVLLDFGAAREFSEDTVAQFGALLRAGLAGDRAAVDRIAGEIGYFDETMPRGHRDRLVGLMLDTFAVMRDDAPFDFAGSGLAARLRDAALEIAADRQGGPPPPVDGLFLQRKAAGMYLLGARLRARVAARPLVERFIGPV
ncbi:ABC1 kinase family protein [Limimaricola pyoseonensis]|uniref:ABC1 family protein n=1 Tax=Limimaricola pyoseonensis TaxID=521013 RepID=A0A1G7IYB3_9RHOB|nr:AarF/ABC1/UbiB kinase family protein [Limimaricola pyoseonensis]SDF17618.1 ABC1 family protein [Limimaricola pyoseonensis]